MLIHILLTAVILIADGRRIRQTIGRNYDRLQNCGNAEEDWNECLKSTVFEIEKDLAKLDKWIKGTFVEIDRVKNETNNLDGKINDNMKASYDNIIIEKEKMEIAMDNKIDAVKGYLKEMSRNYTDALKTTVERFRAEIGNRTYVNEMEINERIDAVDSEVDGVIAELANKMNVNQTKKLLGIANATAESRFNSLESKVENVETDLDNKIDVDEVETHFDTVNSTVEDGFKSLESKIADKIDINEAEKKFDIINSTVKNVRDKFNRKLNVNLGNHDKRLRKEFREEIDAVKKYLEGLINGTNNRVAGVETKLDGKIDDNKAEFNSKIAGVNSTVKSVKNELDIKIDEKTANINASIKKVDSKVRQVRADMGANETNMTKKLDNISSAVEKVKTELNSKVEAKTAKINKSIKSVNFKVEDIETELGQKIDGNKAEITSVNSTVEQFETKMVEMIKEKVKWQLWANLGGHDTLMRETVDAAKRNLTELIINITDPLEDSINKLKETKIGTLQCVSKEEYYNDQPHDEAEEHTIEYGRTFQNDPTVVVAAQGAWHYGSNDAPPFYIKKISHDRSSVKVNTWVKYRKGYGHQIRLRIAIMACGA